MKILITGATGFVGEHLIRLLQDAGCEIVYLTRNRKGFGNEFVWDFKGHLPEGLPECNIIIHLAACVDFGLNFNIEQYNVNTVSTLKLAAYAKDRNAYFIFASTVGIHGNRYYHIDDNTPINPENHYAISKYLAEETVKTCADNYSILRICGIYGINGPSHLGLNKAITEAVCLKKPPVLIGTGKAKRNYICVSDVAWWIMELVKEYQGGKASKTNKIRETLYLASPEVMTIEEYLQTIVDVILPNQQMARIEGNDASDMVVTPSDAPFRLRTFREYLYSLL